MKVLKLIFILLLACGWFGVRFPGIPCWLFSSYSVFHRAEVWACENYVRELEEYVPTNFSAHNKAIALLQQILEINERIHGKDSYQAADSLRELALLYEKHGEYDQALPLLQRSLEIIERELPGWPGNTDTYRDLARLYVTLGQYDKALPLTLHAAGMLEETYGSESSANFQTIQDVAVLYDILGQFDKSLPLYQRALTIGEKTFGPKHFANVEIIQNLAMLYDELGQYDKSLPLYQRALAIREKNLDSNPVYLTTNANILPLAELYDELGQYDKSLPLFQRALSNTEYFNGLNHASTAIVMSNLATHYSKAKKPDLALGMYQNAYSTALSARVKDVLKLTQENIGFFYAEHDNPTTAIFYYKGAVNNMQSIRTEARELDKSLQKSLLKKNEIVYKELADLLIDAGRLPEAQQVLSMLKDDEYFDFIRRDAKADTRSTLMNYNGAEGPFSERLNKLGNNSAALSGQLNVLNNQAKLGLTSEQEKQHTRIKAQLAEQSKQTIALLNDIAQQLPAAKKQQLVEVGKENLDQLRVTLTSLGHGAVLLSYIVTEKRVHILLTTPKVLLVREAEISTKELNHKIAEFRRVLQNPARDPRPLAQEMYQLLIAPVADDLKQANAQTLMLSLDGSLRYLPMAALYDGEAYLAERYPLAMYTEVAKDKLNTKPEVQWKVAGLGLTQKIGEFSALPSVKQELTGIVKGKFWEGAEGILPGDIYLDQDFTQSRLHDVLNRDYSVLHISSHFKFIPGTEAQSFLLLGDGTQLSLAALRTGGWKFNTVDLMTLSACETGLGGGRDANGREIEGFGVLAQRQGAKGVLATLWPVADQSTAILMQSLYRLRQEKSLTKAEALREAQLALISGKHVHPTVSRKTPITNNAGAATANAPTYTPDPAKPYAHPYYWAPFILMGNWL